jgi:hypothetical protein
MSKRLAVAGIRRVANHLAEERFQWFDALRSFTMKDLRLTMNGHRVHSAGVGPIWSIQVRPGAATSRRTHSDIASEMVWNLLHQDLNRRSRSKGDR